MKLVNMMQSSNSLKLYTPVSHGMSYLLHAELTVLQGWD